MLRRDDAAEARLYVSALLRASGQSTVVSIVRACVCVCAWAAGDDDGHSLDHAQQLSVTTESHVAGRLMAAWSNSTAFAQQHSAIDVVGKCRFI